MDEPVSQSRQDRIDHYYQDESAASLAEWLVDAEDDANANADFPIRALVDCFVCGYEIVLRGLYPLSEVQGAVASHIAVCEGVVR